MIEHDKQKRSRWERLAFPLFLLALCLLLLLDGILAHVLTPTVNVTIVPDSKTVALTQSITGASINARVLSPNPSSQSQTAPATGHKHQVAAAAHGFLTFYNGEFTPLFIRSGMTMTSAGGVQVATDQGVTIPAGAPPFYGHVTVAAHAMQVGSKGNIGAYAIDQACCYSAVLAVNFAAFSGGLDTRDYNVVTKNDIQKLETSLRTQLFQLEQVNLMSQLMLNEALVMPACTSTTRSNHRVEDEATQVTVTVSKPCPGIAYDVNALREKAVQLLSAKAARDPGNRYNLVGSTQTSILSTTITNQKRVSITFQVSMTGVWAYQIDQQQIKALIAGKIQQEASKTLLAQPGIHNVIIAGITSNEQVPDDLNHIHLFVRYSTP